MRSSDADNSQVYNCSVVAGSTTDSAAAPPYCLVLSGTVCTERKLVHFETRPESSLCRAVVSRVRFSVQCRVVQTVVTHSLSWQHRVDNRLALKQYSQSFSFFWLALTRYVQVLSVTHTVPTNLTRHSTVQLIVKWEYSSKIACCPARCRCVKGFR